MKRAFLGIVTFLSCILCVLGDLEIFPGINLEDQQRKYHRPDEVYAPLYVERRRQLKSLYPQLEQEYFGPGQSQPEFSERIKARLRRIQEQLKRRRKQLLEQAENSYKNSVVPDLPDREDEDYGKLVNQDREFDRYTYQNERILDDVRPYPQEDSDFSFHGEGENGGEQDQKTIGRYHMQGEDRDGGEKSTDSAFGKEKYEATLLDDPNDFAYAPPDPRFFQKTPQYSTIPDVKMERGAEGGDVIGENDIENSSKESTKEVPDPMQRTDSSVRVVAVRPSPSDTDTAGVYIIAVVAGISAAATVGLIAFGIGWYNLQKHVKNASDVEYPAYGITGPNKDVSPSGDRRLAQSAQMYHYQHQKQQIIAMERAAGNDRHGSVSEADSDEENEEGDYTVYECPGLAPTGEMEVKNPLFHDDPTPAQTPAAKPSEELVHKK